MTTMTGSRVLAGVAAAVICGGIGTGLFHSNAAHRVLPAGRSAGALHSSPSMPAYSGTLFTPPAQSGGVPDVQSPSNNGTTGNGPIYDPGSPCDATQCNGQGSASNNVLYDPGSPCDATQCYNQGYDPNNVIYDPGSSCYATECATVDPNASDGSGVSSDPPLYDPGSSTDSTQ